MQTNNIYFLLAIIAIVIGVIILLWIILKSNKSVSISKDGVSVYTKQGNFLNKEKVDAEKYRIKELVTLIEKIKNIEILQEQMIYIERELDTYYKENLNILQQTTGLTASDPLYKQYQLIYKIQRIEMERQIRDILKENHLLEKTDWTSYKDRQFRYTWTKAVDILDDLFGTIEVERRVKISEQAREQLKVQYQIKFYEWMDEFKKITEEKVEQLETLQKQLDENLRGVVCTR